MIWLYLSCRRVGSAVVGNEIESVLCHDRGNGGDGLASLASLGSVCDLGSTCALR
jgi:hypothetical protein